MDFRTVKHRVRDGVVAAFSCIGIASLYRRVCARAPRVRIIVFHDVPEQAWFESMICTLTESYNVITPDDFAAGRLESGRTNVLITFDDGYASWVDVALPILAAHNVRALFFVSSALIERAHDVDATGVFMREQLRISPRAPLTVDGLCMLRDAGHTIGGHARTHANLAELEGGALRAEIVEDKIAIEEVLGAPITHFAYPFGTKHHVNDGAAAAVAAAGYTHAYTAISRFMPLQEGRRATFFIPRMCIESGLTPTQLRRWVDGAYDLFDMMKQLCVR